MTKHLLTLVFMTFLVNSLISQKAAIIGINEDQPDGFTFVVLEDIAAGTRIYFTTKEYLKGTCSYEVDGEEVAYWEAPLGGLALGQVVFVEESVDIPNTFMIACSSGEGPDVCGTITLVTGSFNIGTQDELSLFTDVDNDITNGVNVVSSVVYHDHRTTDINILPAANDPRGDTPCGDNTIVLDGLKDLAEETGHFEYSGPRTLPIYRNWLEDPDNYTLGAGYKSLNVNPFFGTSPANEQAVLSSDIAMNIYPNPASHELLISFSSPLSVADLSVEIYTLQGNLLQRYQAAGLDRNIHIRLPEMPAGAYVLRVKSEKYSYAKPWIKK